MPFIWHWIWEKLRGIGKITAQPQGLGGTEMDHQVGEKVLRNGRKVPAQKSNPSPKSPRVRSNNTGKTGRKSTGAAIRAAAAKGKAKSKTVSKG